MKFTKGRNVKGEAYQFVQSLPEDRISWMLKLHRLYIIQAMLFTLWLVVGIVFSVSRQMAFVNFLLPTIVIDSIVSAFEC